MILRWCYTRRFATTTFSATHNCSIVATFFRMVTTLLEHCNAVMHYKSSLRIVPCNITFMEEMSYMFLLTFFPLPLIFSLVATSISHFLTAATNSCFSSNEKWLLISRPSSPLFFFSLSFAGLSPISSFSLSFSFSIFQICGHNN